MSLSVLTRTPALLGLLLIALNTHGCKQNAAPVGTWVLDVEALQRRPEILKLPSDQQKGALRLAQKMLGEVRITLHPNGRYEQRLAGRTLEGQFTLSEPEGQRFKLQVKPEGRPEQTLTFELVDPRRAQMTTPDGATLVLVRQ